MHLPQRKLVRDVIPNQRCGREFHCVVECGQCLIVLPKVQVGIAQAHLQFGTLGRQRCGLFELRGSLIVLMPLGIHNAKIGVGILIERIDLELLVECRGRVVVLAILPVSAAQIVVGKLVVGIDFNLLLERRHNGIIVAYSQIHTPQLVPGKFVLGIDLRGSLQQSDRHREIPIVHGSHATLHQLVGLHVGGRNRHAGGRILDPETLPQVGADGAAEGFIVRAAARRKFVLSKRQLAACGEDVIVKFVSGLVLRVVALQGERERRVRGVLGRELQLDFVCVLGLRTQLQRFGVGVSIVVADIRQIEGR